MLRSRLMLRRSARLSFQQRETGEVGLTTLVGNQENDATDLSKIPGPSGRQGIKRRRLVKTEEAIKTEINLKTEDETVSVKQEVEHYRGGIKDGAAFVKEEKVTVTSTAHRPQPKRWREQLRGIEEMRKDKTAEVDTMGCEAFWSDNIPAPEARFRVLLAAMLSSQTRDNVTAAAMKKLIAEDLAKPRQLAEASTDTIAKAIYPVGFYNNKAKYLKQTAQLLVDKYEDHETKLPDIPQTLKELVALPGVGPKMAHLVMNVAWKNSQGICVDIHVHRIANRLGWVKTWTKKSNQGPEKTREELEQWLPKEHWVTINPLLVGFGQQICAPVRPKCEACTINHICPSASTRK